MVSAQYTSFPSSRVVCNGAFDLTDRRACGHPNGHCPECGQPTPSLRAEYCSIACRYDSQEAQRWKQYEPRAESLHGGRLTQNSPSENPSGQPIQNKDTVDGDAGTSEEIRRRKPRSLW